MWWPFFTAKDGEDIFWTFSYIDPNSFFGNTGYVLASGNTQLIMENGNIKAVNHPEPYQQATRLQFKDAEGNKLYGHYSDSTGTFYVNKNYGYDPNR